MLFRSDRKSTRLNSSHTIISYALPIRSEEHTSELQSHDNIVCRLLLEKKIKTVTSNEHFVQGHFAGNCVMPGVLQVEAMVKTGVFFLMTGDPPNASPFPFPTLYQ